MLADAGHSEGWLVGRLEGFRATSGNSHLSSPRMIPCLRAASRKLPTAAARGQACQAVRINSALTSAAPAAMAAWAAARRAMGTR